MDRPDNKHLDFVLRHYQAGKFDTRQAIRCVMAAKGQPATARTIPLWRKWAAAASFTLLLIGGAWAAYTAFTGTADSPQDETTITQHPSPDTPPKHFHFDNTPLPDVLRELGGYYGVTLTASDTDKRLTADFDADSLDEAVTMIEQVLGVSITKKE